MLSPFLIIGVGGSGGKTIRAMRQTLLRRLRAKGWKGEFPEAWQFLEIDTVSTQGGGNFAAPLLPPNQFLGLVPREVNYTGLRKKLEGSLPSEDKIAALGGWLPEKTPVPIQSGAGQYRTLGRAVVAAQLPMLQHALKRSHEALTASGVIDELKEVSRVLYGRAEGASPDPMALVISSVAGGSGAGIYLDVVEALKSIDEKFEKRTQVLLFGPDVFNNIPAGLRDSIPANAMGAMNETLAGMWAKGPGEGSASLFNSAGLNKKGEEGFGPRNTYLIGASNGVVSFGDQDSVYRAAGESLATLVSDDAVQNWMVEYAIVNVFVNSANPIICDDVSQLKNSSGVVEVFQSQPLASIGVGRVSLGLDRFSEYIAEGASRWTVERLLWPQFVPTNPQNPQTPQQIIEEAVDRSWGEFLIASGLNERQESDDVVNALISPSVDDRCRAFAQNAITKVSFNVPPAGLPANQWISSVGQYFTAQRKSFETEERAEIHKMAQVWTTEIQDRILNTVSLVTARRGLNVAARLVEKLREEVKFVATQELPLEASTRLRKLDEIPSAISGRLPQGLSAVQTAAMTEVVGPIINKAANHIVSALRMSLAAELMIDLDNSFLQPLETSLRNSVAELLISATSAQNRSGEKNPFPGYANISTGVIPERFNPSVVEKLLIDVNTFPNQLKTLVQQSLEESLQNNWESRFIERIILGTHLDSRGDNETPSLIKMRATWVPQDQDARRHSEGAQKAQFEMITDPDQYIERNRDWLTDPVTALGKFLVQDLVDYLIHPDPTIQNTRRNDFRTAFSSALKLSVPLCSLNSALIGQLHPNVLKKGPRYVHMSMIPFKDQGNLKDLYDLTVKEIQEAHVWDPSESPKSFQNVGGIQQIDIFSTLTSAMNPMVFSSLMEPITGSWSTNNNSPQLRQGFWTNRRARPLTEAIPMAPEQIEKLVRGWFVSQILGLRKAEAKDSKGPKISVWAREDRKFVDFPNPLLGLKNESISSNPDLLPAVLESIGLAMAHCNQLSNLSPLYAYWEMMSIGERFNELLENWIRRSETLEGAPIPDSLVAGSVNGTFDERKSAIISAVEKTQTFLNSIIKADERKDPWEITRTTEIKHITAKSIHEITNFLEALVDEPGSLV